MCRGQLAYDEMCDIDDGFDIGFIESLRQDSLDEVRTKLLRKGFTREQILYILPSLENCFEEGLDSCDDWEKYLDLDERHLRALKNDEMAIWNASRERDYDNY